MYIKEATQVISEVVTEEHHIVALESSTEPWPLEDSCACLGMMSCWEGFNNFLIIGYKAMHVCIIQNTYYITILYKILIVM